MKHDEMRKHMGGGTYHGSHHGAFENEVEKPSVPPVGHDMGMGMMGFKSDADPIAYGQASHEGCKSDEKKIHAQMKQYHWD